MQKDKGAHNQMGVQPCLSIVSMTSILMTQLVWQEQMLEKPYLRSF